jgi:hypothetical protein
MRKFPLYKNSYLLQKLGDLRLVQTLAYSGTGEGKKSFIKLMPGGCLEEDKIDQIISTFHSTNREILQKNSVSIYSCL